MDFEEYEFNYKDYEQKCNEIRMKNEIYLEEFEKDLTKSGLKENTIKRHLNNVNFYINNFLLREEAADMVTGTGAFYLNNFLGIFIIRKCMWSTPATIKSNVASIKKFYKSMLEKGHIREENYNGLLYTIKEDMNTWLDDCEAYNDSSLPNPFSPF